MGRLVIEETSVYEIDEDCVKEKELERRKRQEKMEAEGLREKKERYLKVSAIIVANATY